MLQIDTVPDGSLTTELGHYHRSTTEPSERESSAFTTMSHEETRNQG